MFRLLALIIFCLFGSLGISSQQEDFLTQTPFQSEELIWEKKVAPTIHRAFDLLDSGSNIATFRLKVKTPLGEAVKDFSEFLFVSGGNRQAVNTLEKQIGLKCYCIYDFYPPIENQPTESNLRRGISDFFELIDANSDSGQFEELQKRFNSFLETIQETRLEELKAALENTFKSYATLRMFQEKNKRDLSVQDLKLYNTTREGNVPQPLNFDGVFGDNFLLNFADSEQSIRKFMARGKGNVNTKGDHIDFVLNKYIEDYLLAETE